MSVTKVDPPPINLPVVDPKSGMPSRPFIEFLHRMWKRTGGEFDKPEQTQEELSATEAALADLDGRVDEVSNVADEALETAETGQVPIGSVTPYAGAIGDIPSNWSVCDGTNGTPDLRGMFIRAASGSVPAGSSGGSLTGSGTTDDNAASNTGTNAASDTDPSATGLTINLTKELVSAPKGDATDIEILTDATLQEPTPNHSHAETPHQHAETPHGHTFEVDTVPPYYALVMIMRIS